MSNFVNDEFLLSNPSRHSEPTVYYEDEEYEGRFTISAHVHSIIIQAFLMKSRKYGWSLEQSGIPSILTRSANSAWSPHIECAC